jgi:tetratricopeptide (TPR) repeat protein
LYILKTAADNLNYFHRSNDRLILTVILCGILAFIIDNLFSYTILAPENAIFWWVTVAVMFSWIKSTKFPLDKVYHRSRLLNSRFIIAIWLMATSIFGLCLLRLGIADNYFYKGTSYLRTGNVSAALDFLKKAKGLNPIDGKISSAQGEVYLVCYKVTKDKNYLDYAKGEFERAVRLRPKVANNYLFLGHIYMAQDEIEMARKNYSKASMLAPYSDEYRRLAQCIK